MQTGELNGAFERPVLMFCRFAYKVVLVADGNFKADHVAQKDTGDVWLWDGGGMAPNQSQYHEWLRKAIERLTVSILTADAVPDSRH